MHQNSFNLWLKPLLMLFSLIMIEGCKPVENLDGAYTIGTSTGTVISVDQSGESVTMAHLTEPGAEQQWVFQSTDSPGVYRILSVLSGTALTASDDQQNLMLRPPEETDSQLFKVLSSPGKEQYRISSVSTLRTLSIASDDTTDVSLADALPGSGYSWTLTKVDKNDDDTVTAGDAHVENYAKELGNLKYSTGTNKKLCGYSVRYPNGKGSIKRYRYQNYLETFARDMNNWSRGKLAYSSVKTAPQAVMPDNTIRPKSVLIKEAKRGRSLGTCHLNVFKGAFSGSNAPSRNQANCGGSGLSKYCLRHEAGHTWGLAHDGIYNQDTCKKVDSGVSQMSGYKTGFNIPHLHWLGWVEEDQVKQLQWDYPSQDNYVFGEHWVSIRPLDISKSGQEGEHPYGLVIDLRRSGNRLWLAPNKETPLKSPGQPGYHKQEDALLAIVSAPFESPTFHQGHRWKGTATYRFIDENRPWNNKLMDDIEVSVIERTPKAMLVSIEPSDTYGSCSALPNASYQITKIKSVIKNADQMGRDNVNLEFTFNTEYKDRDSKCSRSMCDLNAISLSVWDTCYFENDPQKTDLIKLGKVKISSQGHCRGPQTLQTRFSTSDQQRFQSLFSDHIICKPAYQCFYSIQDTVRFPVTTKTEEQTVQPVAIETILPNNWKEIIQAKR